MYVLKAEKITTRQASVLLGVSPSRVRQLIATGQLKSEKIGRDHILEMEQVKSFAKLSKGRKGSPRKL